jgi:hypothetical protein
MLPNQVEDSLDGRDPGGVVDDEQVEAAAQPELIVYERPAIEKRERVEALLAQQVSPPPPCCTT